MSKPLITVIIFAVAVSFGVFLAWPKYQDLNGLRAEIKQKEAELKSKSDYYARIKSISVELAGYQDQLAKISTALPEVPSLPPVFNYLQEASADAGLLLEDITLGAVQLSEDEDGSGRIREININLQLSGSYQALRSFISNIEKSARLFAVKSINFESPKDPEDPLSFKVNIAANSY